ncbi:MAG: hypothetical protein NVSMB51_04460 [Solirubrobacteraceae bacterium]
MVVQRAFYFDLASPEAYLAAERALSVLPAPWEWQPIVALVQPGGFRCESEELIFRAELERRAAAQGAQPLRWPRPFPFDSARAMLAATYAKQIGRTVAFALAAFRQAFAGGHSLERDDHLLLAGAACEMHPAAVLKALEMNSVRGELERASKRAAALGVRETPAVSIGEQVLQGPGCLERAVAA